jgi:predicted transcriptional regulator
MEGVHDMSDDDENFCPHCGGELNGKPVTIDDILEAEDMKVTDKVAELSLKGLTQMQIGDRLGMSQPSVSYHLRRAREQWRKRAAINYDDHLNREVAHYDLLLSKLEKGIDMGDWKHIQTAVTLAERRAKLIGLDHSSKLEEARVFLEAQQLELMAKILEVALESTGLDEPARHRAIEAGLKVIEPPDTLELA